MVAKITCGSSLYGALAYNHDKVDAGTARVLATNKILTDQAGYNNKTMQNAIHSIDSYIAGNSTTENPVVHISLNPAPGDNLTDEQMKAIAKDYLEKTGFGDQPYIVYKHEDIDRHHLHIVTTRIRRDGTRISDSYEHRRSMNACRELELQYGLKQVAGQRNAEDAPYLKKVDYSRGDVKRQIGNTLKSLVDYKFHGYGEWSALLSLYNIEAKQVRGEHEGQPYVGVVYSATDGQGNAVGNPFKSSLFGKKFGHEGVEKRAERNKTALQNGGHAPRITAAVAAAMRGNPTESMLKERLGRQGIGLVLRRNDTGRIYGVTFIDHHNREVYNGSRLGRQFSANALQTMFDNTDVTPRGEAANTVLRNAPPGGETAANSPSQDANMYRGDEPVIDTSGIFDFEQHGRDFQEEAFARRMRKKKKRRGRSL